MTASSSAARVKLRCRAHFDLGTQPVGEAFCKFGRDGDFETVFSGIAGTRDPQSSSTVEPMREFIKADSLAFVSIDGLYRAVGEKPRVKECPQFCDACFTGDYPTSLTDLMRREDKQKQLTLPVGKVA